MSRKSSLARTKVTFSTFELFKMYILLDGIRNKNNIFEIFIKQTTAFVEIIKGKRRILI